MGALIAIVAVIVLMMFGVPVVFSFAAMALLLSVVYDIDSSALMTTGFWSVNSVIIVALPLFVMTGYLMQTGGIARRLVEFVEALVGRTRTGMGTSMVVACGIFGAISGTATAAVASIGSIMIGPMEKHGYSRGYTSGLLGISSLLGLLIPPSITMILYAVVTRQSVAACFLATIGPGILLMIMLSLLNRLHVKRRLAGDDAALAWRERLSETASTGWKAIPALMLPVIILGVFTVASSHQPRPRRSRCATRSRLICLSIVSLACARLRKPSWMPRRQPGSLSSSSCSLSL